MNNLEQFLKPTKYCDSDNKDIKNILYEILGNIKDDKEKAIKLFYWVRDNILYRVGYWNRMATDTLKEGSGTCTNKANLLVSFFRSIGIPAGYGVMSVMGKEYFGPIMLPKFKSWVSEKSTHVFCYVYIDNSWIKCDPSDDYLLSKKTNDFNYTTKLVEWNGHSDAILNIKKDHILSISEPIQSIDYLMEKKPRNGRGIGVKIANIYINFLRINNEKIRSTEEAEKLFFKYLKNKKPLYFLIFNILNYFK